MLPPHFAQAALAAPTVAQNEQSEITSHTPAPHAAWAMTPIPVPEKACRQTRRHAKAGRPCCQPARMAITSS